MAEYIEREALLETLNRFAPEHYHALANRVIAEQPAADVVEVVRCKDCKFQIKTWQKDGRMKDGGYWLYFCGRNEDQFVCHAVNGYDDEFCSYGERKETE